MRSRRKKGYKIVSQYKVGNNIIKILININSDDDFILFFSTKFYFYFDYLVALPFIFECNQNG